MAETAMSGFARGKFEYIVQHTLFVVQFYISSPRISLKMPNYSLKTILSAQVSMKMVSIHHMLIMLVQIIVINVVHTIGRYEYKRVR